MTRCPAGLSVHWFGSSIPDEIKSVIPLLHASSSEVMRPCIQKAVEYLKTGRMENDEDYILFSKTLGEGDQGSMVTGIYSILRAAIGSKVNSSTIVTDLKRMNVPTATADDLGQAIVRARSQLEIAALEHRIRFPRLDKLRWRIDVSISSGSLSRVMRPSILMQMILSDGRIKSFEVSIEQFNQLRYGVAKMLREMQTLERHPIMRVQRELLKREEEERLRK